MKIEGELIKGRFIRRLNRFEAVVEIEGVQELVHTCVQILDRIRR